MGYYVVKEINSIIESQSNMRFKLQQGERKQRNLKLPINGCLLI